MRLGHAPGLDRTRPSVIDSVLQQLGEIGDHDVGAVGAAARRPGPTRSTPTTSRSRRRGRPRPRRGRPRTRRASGLDAERRAPARNVSGCGLAGEVPLGGDDAVDAGSNRWLIPRRRAPPRCWRWTRPRRAQARRRARPRRSAPSRRTPRRRLAQHGAAPGRSSGCSGRARSPIGGSSGAPSGRSMPREARNARTPSRGAGRRRSCRSRRRRRRARTARPCGSPPSGPRSMIQSAVLITSRLCSITSTVLPWSTSRDSTVSSLRMSSKCRPVVGSSRM